MVLFLTSTLYAIALEWVERRWQFVSDYTYLTVVVGVTITLGGLAYLDPACALLALVLFAVTGTPMIVRAIMDDARKRQELRRAFRGRDDD